MITSAISGTDVFTSTSSEFGSLLFVASRSSLTRVCYRSIVNGVLVECRVSALRKIDHLLVIENKVPYTIHEPEYVEYGERYMESYLNARAPPAICEANYLPRHGEPAAVNPYSQALRYMANSRAYFRGPHHSFFPSPSSMEC